MNPRGHRELAALVMLVALVLSALVLIPANAQAATNQVTGLVKRSDNGLPIGGATVTLVDAKGVLSPLTTTTAGDGAFAFTPQTSNYTVSVTAPGYYSGGVATPFRFDGTATVSENVTLTPFLQSGQTSFSVKFHVQSAASGAFIGGATVSVYNASRQASGQSALIGTAITNASAGVNAGNVTMGLWASNDYSVQVNATGYGLLIEKLTIPSTCSSTVCIFTMPMSAQWTVIGHAWNTNNQLLSAGLTATLYRIGVAKTNGSKVIPGTVTGSFFSIYAPPGSYKLLVDANGYTAKELWVNLSASPSTYNLDTVSPIYLSPSPQESYLTTVLFGTTDWNNLVVYRNWTLHADSIVSGLGPAGVRDLREQINYTFGTGQDGNGTLSTADASAFTAWLAKAGPLYVATSSFLLLNGKSYLSSMTSYQILSVGGLTTPNVDVQVKTVATYSIQSTATISYGQPKYWLNLTLYPDTNTTVYHNETYIVQLPRAYEMASDTILPSTTPPAITTYNFTRITVDPGLVSGGTQPQIRMVLQQSLNGTARANVAGPSGKFYVVNSTYQNYQAYVAANTKMYFSANQSTDPVGQIASGNFTWEFEANVNPSVKGWGIWTTHTYASTGQFTVNLTVVQGGGNVTYRDITVWVDGIPPTADFKTNLTGPNSAKGVTLRINESTTVKFDGSLSSDQAYANKTGVIPDSGYVWDFNGDNITDATGRSVSWTFTKPGYFNVSLNVTDGVGWKGTNATMVVIVNDTAPPVPAFTILDPNNDYAPVSTLVEGHTYTFNAGTTTDNYDPVSKLNFTWSIPGPLIGRAGTPTTLYGVNITFGWSAWNNSYQVKLTVNDTGFGSGKPNSGVKTFNESVQIDWKLHADLYINVGTMKVDNQNPEAGAVVTITLNVTNKANRATASQIEVSVSEGSGTQTTSLMDKNLAGNGWNLVDKNGNPLANATIASGATATMKITVTVVGQGNKTLAVVVQDRTEPFTAVTAENTASTAINVNQPAWVTYAIVAAIVGVFLVVIGAMYYRRKVKAGDWQPRFRRSKEGKDEGGKEKPRKEKEVKEEKKRL